jgi:hypothetical protein
MGRYAFFKTKFEYKFGFGCQPSEDIELFGGTVLEKSNSDGVITWSSKDKDIILQKLERIDYNKIPINTNFTINEDNELNIDDYLLPINFDNFQKNLNGTLKLSCHLFHFYNNFSSEKDFFKYRLGCIIYHQLLYEPNLSANYEL